MEWVWDDKREGPEVSTGSVTVIPPGSAIIKKFQSFFMTSGESIVLLQEV